MKITKTTSSLKEETSIDEKNKVLVMKMRSEENNSIEFVSTAITNRTD